MEKPCSAVRESAFKYTQWGHMGAQVCACNALSIISAQGMIQFVCPIDTCASHRF